MKLEIESVSNGYVITVPKSEYDEIERKYVVEERDDSFADNKIGYVSGVCSEHMRWEILETMEKSLENPKNDLGD